MCCCNSFDESALAILVVILLLQSNYWKDQMEQRSYQEESRVARMQLCSSRNAQKQSRSQTTPPKRAGHLTELPSLRPKPR